MRAMAVLSFLLLPPLQSRQALSPPAEETRERPHPPVLPTLFVGVFGEIQLVDGRRDHISDEGLGNASQSGKHGQQFSARHPLYQSIKLRTVAYLLLDLRSVQITECEYSTQPIWPY